MLPFVRMFDYGNIAPEIAPVVKVDGHLTYVVVLYSNGNLYARGTNTGGQFGQGGNASLTAWSLINTECKNVWCNENAILIQKQDNSWWCAGVLNNLGVASSTVHTWTSADALFSTLNARTIKQVVLASNSISVLCTDNTIWNAGIGTSGQMGNGSSISSIGTFVQGTIPNGIVPESIVASSLMHGFIGTNKRLYYTGGIVGENASNETTIRISYTLSSVHASYTEIIDYRNNINSTSVYSTCIGRSSAGVKVLQGGRQNYGQIGTNENSNTLLAISLNATVQPSGNILRPNTGYAFCSTHIVTDEGIYGTGLNSLGSPYNGKLSVGDTSVRLTYTKCIVPSHITDFTNVHVYATTNRTYMTDGYKVYSSGQYVTYGGPSSLVFTDDSPV